jgi:hypothetical protein
MRTQSSALWIAVSDNETASGSASDGFPRVVVMSTTLLTRRRAVDHCRVRSSLCRMR